MVQRGGGTGVSSCGSRTHRKYEDRQTTSNVQDRVASRWRVETISGRGPNRLKLPGDDPKIGTWDLPGGGKVNKVNEVRLERQLATQGGRRRKSLKNHPHHPSIKHPLHHHSESFPRPSPLSSSFEVSAFRPPLSYRLPSRPLR